MNRSLFETITGFAIILFALAFLNFAYTKAEKNTSSSGYVINAKFDRIDGISVGSEVKVSGIKIGEVIGKKLDETTYRAILSIHLDENIKLPTDSSAQIVSESLLGQKFVSIMPGAEDEFLQNGGEILFTQSSVNLENLIGKMMFSKDEKKDDKTNSNN